MKWVNRLAEGMARTREAFTARVDEALGRSDPQLFDALEAALIQSDLGLATTSLVIEHLRRHRARDAGARRAALRDILRDLLGDTTALRLDPPPAAVLVLGVNGAGKTTTVGKLAHRLVAEGRTVLLAAADTFRAAAIEQLVIWGQRAGCEVVKHAPGADPAAVIFDAVQATKARGIQVLLADTAGRLHTKVNLMDELKKINRVITRALPGAPVERLLVLDATTGQNAIQQARIFKDAVDVTGLVLAKLDGSAKGGAVLAIRQELGLPVLFVGTGEAIADLHPFDPQAFVDALLPP